MAPQYPVVPVSEAKATAEIEADKVKPGKTVQADRPIVMIVDDERIIADSLSAIFRQNQYTVLTAYDGHSALDLARRTPPRLVISDVVMPGMSGVELAIALQKECPDCKILLFSGQAATVDLLAKARETGNNFTALSKPIHPTEMLRQVAQCLQTPAV